MKKIERDSAFHIPAVYQLKIELEGSALAQLSGEQADILSQYGRVDKSICRTILVSGQTTLRALHFIIMAAFGLQHSHLHQFSLTKEQMETLLDGKVEQYRKLAGIYFRYECQEEQDDFRDDDYEEDDGLSPLEWYRTKYTGNPNFFSMDDAWSVSQLNLRRDERFQNEESPFSWQKKLSAIEQFLLNNLERSPEQLREMLFIDEILCASDGFPGVNWQGKLVMTGLETSGQKQELWDILDPQIERQPEADVAALGEIRDQLQKCRDEYALCRDSVQKAQLGQLYSDLWHEKYRLTHKDIHPVNIPPLTDHIEYEYDYGDNWTFTIDAEEIYELMPDKTVRTKNGNIISGRRARSIAKVWNQNCPVCLHADGLPPVEDVGGLNGYIRFLDHLFSERNRQDEMDDPIFLLDWADSQGWRPYLPDPDELL